MKKISMPLNQHCNEPILSPYRVEKFDKKRRRGSLSYAMLFEEIHGGVVRASDPESNIISGNDPLIDPCCGTDMIPLAAQ